MFNQPLDFDTSRVTDMYGMFYVRSARAPWQSTLRSHSTSLHAACAATTAHALPACPVPARRPPLPMPSPWRSAEHAGVQPAAGL